MENEFREKISRKEKTDIVVLAGFLTILSENLINEFPERIINIHPALLPDFGGPGMYGHHVHEAVLASGKKESGCTVHIVDKGCDTGRVILQRKVPVMAGDTPSSRGRSFWQRVLTKYNGGDF